MIRLILCLIIVICFFLLLRLSRIPKIDQVRKKGNYPFKDPTMFDVRKLLLKGDKYLALKVYSQIFKTTRSKAKKDIEELERSLKAKNNKT